MEAPSEFRLNSSIDRQCYSSLVTRSQTRKDSKTYSSVLAYKIIQDQQLKPSRTFPNQEKQEFDPEYFAISACVEPTGENSIESVFST